jgi:hypothetical protein
LVYKEAPQLVYTGLTAILGKPREYEKNEKEEQYFVNDNDINIPIETTNEFAATHATEKSNV